jgi:hypothetical protein
LIDKRARLFGFVYKAIRTKKRSQGKFYAEERKRKCDVLTVKVEIESIDQLDRTCYFDDGSYLEAKGLDLN